MCVCRRWPQAALAAFDEASCPIGPAPAPAAGAAAGGATGGGSPAGAHGYGPAGALCGLLRVAWHCLHVWELDGGMARRTKLLLQVGAGAEGRGADQGGRGRGAVVSAGREDARLGAS